VTVGGRTLVVVQQGARGCTYDVDAPAGRFFVAVRAQTTAGLSERSDTVDIRVPGCSSLAAPVGLAGAVNGSVVTLTWTASPGATAYLVRAGSASGQSNLAAVAVPTNGLSARAPNGTYYIRVLAQNSCTVSAPSSEIVVTVGTPVVVPGAPLNLVSTVSGQDVSLTWSAPATGSAPTGYLLEAGNAPGLANLAVLPLGPATSFATTGVPRGTYYVRVRAINSAATGPPSGEVAVVVR
jgi:predicted phage tail protein